jgi:hypothetical protein
MTKDALRGDRMRIARSIGAVAAVVLIAFSAGWLGKARVATQPAGAPAIAQTTSSQGGNSLAGNIGSIDFTGDPGTGIGTLVSNTLGRTLAVPGGTRRPGGYQVALTDALGRVVAVQHFDTLEEAREFSEDVSHLQHQQQQIRNVAEPVVYKDQF